MKNFTICLDMDEVLTQWCQPILDEVKDHSREDITDWNLERTPRLLANYLSKKHADFYANLKPIDGALEGVKKLHKFADVYLVTSIPLDLPDALHANTLEAKRRWVKRHLPFIGQHKIIVSHHKAMVRGDILVDDKAQNIDEWMATGRIGIVYDNPWNRECDASYRACNWDDVVTYCEEVYESRTELAPTCCVSELRESDVEYL